MTPAERTLTRLAQKLRVDGLDADAIDAALQMVNAKAKVPLAREEVEGIAESVGASEAVLDPRRLAWQPLGEVEMRSVRFLDKPLIQADAFHLLVGRKGQGKGTMLASFAAQMTRGELGEKRNLIWIGSEDSTEIDIKPRLVAAGGDPDRVFVLKEGWPELPRDLLEIEQAIAEIGDVGMVVVDPLSNHVAGKDSDKDAIRVALAPLNTLADDHRLIVFGVRHLSEKDFERSGGVLARILGASAWVQVPRAVLAVAKDPANEGVTHVQVVAGNRVPGNTAARAFRIDGVLLDGLDEEVTRCQWLGESAKDVEELLTAKTNKEVSKAKRAREIALDQLEDAPEQTLDSKALNAQVAEQSDLAVGSVRNVITKLKDDGLIRFAPDRDVDGSITGWHVVRTSAPRN